MRALIRRESTSPGRFSALEGRQPNARQCLDTVTRRTGHISERPFDISVTPESALRESLVESLGVDRAQVAAFQAGTALFGALPELDSMAVATLLTDLEDRLGIVIDDDEIDAEIFETFGSLVSYLSAKIQA